MAPWLALRLPPPPVPIMAVYYAAWTVRLWYSRHPVARRIATSVIVTTLVWMLAAPTPASFAWLLGRGASGSATARGSRASLRVTFLDVGQADASLVRFPNHASLLVDAAGSANSPFDIGSRIIAPALWALGVRRLDYLALTHGDPDHIGGAPAILRDFRPREVWEGVPVPPLGSMQAIEQAASAEGSAWRILQTGDQLRVGGVDVRIWNPPPPDWERQKVRNDDSLVIELRFGDVSVVLPGDLGREVESELASRFEPAAIRVVKVPHHGSGGSSSSEFVDATRPDVVVVSAGRGNPFGHPAPYVLRRYERAGAAIFRTDQDGAIELETDGQRVTIRTMTGRTLSLPDH